MRSSLPGVFVVILGLAMAGCVNPRLDSASAAATPTMGGATGEPMTDKPVEASVAEREYEIAQAMARRPADTGMSTTELVALLNETSRELGALRANNAKLRADRERTPTVRVETVVKPEANDEKLTADIGSYVKFKQDLVVFLQESERLRVENTTLGTQLAALAEQMKAAQTDLEPLKTEVLAQKEAREKAEASAEKLREQLRAIAKALAAAGLSLDAFSGDREPTARLETSPARVRAAGEGERSR